MSDRAEAFNTGIKPVTKESISTLQYDPRYPNCNQTRHCWQNFVDFHKCVKMKGEGYAPCNQFLNAYRQLCPLLWVEKWNEQLDNGTFAYKDPLV